MKPVSRIRDKHSESYRSSESLVKNLQFKMLDFFAADPDPG